MAASGGDDSSLRSALNSLDNNMQLTNQKIKSSQRQGASAVEFALVAPVVFFLTFACFEVSRVMMIQSAADVAVYEATRAVMVPGARIAEAEEVANRYLGYLGNGDVNIAVTVFAADGTTQDEINDFSSRVRVTVDIPAASNSMLLSQFFGDKTIHSSCTLTFESYSGFYDGSSTY